METRLEPISASLPQRRVPLGWHPACAEAIGRQGDVKHDRMTISQRCPARPSAAGSCHPGGAVRPRGTSRAAVEWAGDRTQTTVWQIDHLNFQSTATDEDPWTLHGTQKPLEAMARPIRNHHGDVYDPFTGSGATLIAADKLGRRD